MTLLFGTTIPFSLSPSDTRMSLRASLIPWKGAGCFAPHLSVYSCLFSGLACSSTTAEEQDFRSWQCFGYSDTCDCIALGSNGKQADLLDPMSIAAKATGAASLQRMTMRPTRSAGASVAAAHVQQRRLDDRGQLKLSSVLWNKREKTVPSLISSMKILRAARRARFARRTNQTCPCASKRLSKSSIGGPPANRSRIPTNSAISLS